MQRASRVRITIAATRKYNLDSCISVTIDGKSEQACDSKPRQILAVLWSMVVLSLYFQGTGLTVRASHKYLKGILNHKGETDRLQHRLLHLYEFDF